MTKTTAGTPTTSTAVVSHAQKAKCRSTASRKKKKLLLTAEQEAAIADTITFVIRNRGGATRRQRAPPNTARKPPTAERSMSKRKDNDGRAPKPSTSRRQTKKTAVPAKRGETGKSAKAQRSKFHVGQGTLKKSAKTPTAKNANSRRAKPVEKKSKKQAISKCKAATGKVTEKRKKSSKTEVKEETKTLMDAKKKKQLKAKLTASNAIVVKAGKRKTTKLVSKSARKLHTMWTGPKRHRVASLNALAKVHCLYENESRVANFEQMDASVVKKEAAGRSESPQPTRTLRSVPGLRAIGKLWDMHDTTSSSEEEDEEVSSEEEKRKAKKLKKKRPMTSISTASASVGKKVPAKRKKNEVVMDLKDMVVRKRMASLNASAILAASYSVERRAKRRSDDSETSSSSAEGNETASDEDYIGDVKVVIKKEEEDEETMDEEKRNAREVCAAVPSNKNKVAVILNQDTDVTFTGVYVNSTTRSTQVHEGYCHIAGMQYRISATSHTQTAATAVATETILQSTTTTTHENESGETATSTAVKSYAPLDALSNMQPPANAATTTSSAPPPAHILGTHASAAPAGGDLTRRHGCASAFSAPPSACGGPQAHHHVSVHPDHYVQGYYQPAGPLISVPHSHSQVSSKSVQLAEPSPSSPSPLHQPPPPSSSVGDSSDSEVIITSVTTAKDQQTQSSAAAAAAAAAAVYRLNHHYAPPTHSYPSAYGPYPTQYYPAPPPHGGPAYPHHDMCYTSFPPPPPHKYMFRRYLPPPPGPPYYSATSPEIYGGQPPSATNQQMVTATSSASSSYPSSSSGPPLPTLIEPYPGPMIETYPPPPTHYYQGYGPAQPCYTHSSPGRPLNYINATYQSCPCPMQSCPKNVHTGPLAGDSKRSTHTTIAKESMPLPPVALALPLEPASATGPPSPARGSAGMPPPPSPAGATYQVAVPPPPPKLETPEPAATVVVDKRRKARVGKAMVRNTMLLMCQTSHGGGGGGGTILQNVKREVESPPDVDEVLASDHKKDVMECGESVKCEDLPEVVVEPPPPQTLLLPCQKTVAENVKVKNMKRKRENVCAPVKDENVLVVDAKRARGSYKDLIRKTANVVRINNGRRKLISECAAAIVGGNRRIMSRARKDYACRRLKAAAKPLSDSNVQSAKQSSDASECNGAIVKGGCQLRKASVTHSSSPQRHHDEKHDNNNGAGSKLLLSSVDRTIESVVRHQIRTETIQEKCVRRARRASGTVSSAKVVKAVKKAKAKKDVPQVVAKMPRRSVQLRWSNGWRWHGDGFDGKVFLNSDELTVTRKCYPSMIHDEGDVIEPRDCVLLKAGQRKNELPFVAKIAALWENPDDGEMMMSLLWYYRPEHTDQGRRAVDQQDEVFASRHKDSNSVACIEDKCYVLTYNEYCRYRKDLRRLEAGVEDTGPCIPSPELYPRHQRQPPTIMGTSADLVFFCRKVYDFRQKRIVKNPS